MTTLDARACMLSTHCGGGADLEDARTRGRQVWFPSRPLCCILILLVLLEGQELFVGGQGEKKGQDRNRQERAYAASPTYSDTQLYLVATTAYPHACGVAHTAFLNS